MSNITLSAVTKAIETLESMVRAEKEYITIAEMLDIAHIAQAGALGIYKCLCFTFLHNVLCLIVASGGLLMEAFLQTSSNYVTRRAWRSVMKKVKANPDYDHKIEVEEIVTAARNSFYFYLLSTLASRGTSANRQLFFITLVIKHKGLSRNGLRLFGLMNLGLSPRSYDPELAAFSERVDQERRSLFH